MRPIMALAAAMLAAGCAHQPPGGMRGAPPSGGMESDQDRIYVRTDALLFVGFDSNGDMRISEAEIAAGALREFTRADASADGIVTPIEFAAWNRLMLGGDGAPRRLDVDRNVDGAITAEEFSREIVARGRNYDRDEDGFITRAELMQERRQMERAPGRQRGGSDGGGREGGGRPPR